MSRIDPTSTKVDIIAGAGRFSLLNYISEFVIYENIFRPALTATLMLTEAHNLIYQFSIVGQETLDIDIGIIDANNDKVRINPPLFHVNSIKDREFIKPKAQLVSLELVSEKMMSDSHAKVSRSYRDKPISDIVADIHDTYLDDGNSFFVESTNRIERCVIPNLSPIEAIKWLAHRAIPENASNNVNYLFFETVSGSFFMSLNSLIGNDPIVLCRFQPRVADVDSNIALDSKIINIDKLKFIKSFNKYQNTKRGIYASKLITHDIVKKKITQYENNYLFDWANSNHLGKHPPVSIAEVETKSASANRTSFAPVHKSIKHPTTNEKALPRMIDSRVEFYPKHDKMYSTWTGDLYDNKAEEWKLQRNSLGLIQNASIYVEGAGVSSVRVGQTIFLTVPTAETSDGDKMSDVEFDKDLSGKFIITGIKHIFSKAAGYIDYRMGLELSKDGLEEPVPYRESTKED